MTALIFPGYIMTSSMALFVCTHYFTILYTVVLVGDGVGSCLGGSIFAMLLVMILCPFRHMDLVLYMCTIGTLHVIPSYGCVIIGTNYMSSGMTWGYV